MRSARSAAKPVAIPVLGITSVSCRPRPARLRQQTFETAIIERYRRRESSVEEALIERCLAGGSPSRRVEDITEALWGTGILPSTV